MPRMRLFVHPHCCTSLHRSCCIFRATSSQAPRRARGRRETSQGNVLSSPRRTSILGETLRHASQWQTSSYELETPYAMETRDSRFLEAEADKAALAAVASTAGLAVASGPSAGLSTNRRNTHFDLPSMRREMLTPR